MVKIVLTTALEVLSNNYGKKKNKLPIVQWAMYLIPRLLLRGWKTQENQLKNN